MEVLRICNTLFSFCGSPFESHHYRSYCWRSIKHLLVGHRVFWLFVQLLFFLPLFIRVGQISTVLDLNDEHMKKTHGYTGDIGNFGE